MWDDVVDIRYNIDGSLRRDDMRYFNIGDKVIIRDWDDMEREFGTDGEDILCQHYFTRDMEEFCGKEYAIVSIELGYDGSKNYILDGKISEDNWAISADMLREAE